MTIEHTFPTVETATLTCNVMVRREGFRQPCFRNARRYRVSLENKSFPDQYRCYRHAHILRRRLKAIGYAARVELVERLKRAKK